MKLPENERQRRQNKMDEFPTVFKKRQFCDFKTDFVMWQLSLAIDCFIYDHFYRTLISYLLVNLAIADMIFAIFIAPSVLLRLTSFHPEGVIAAGLCKFVTGGNVGWIGAVSSIFSLIAIAVERYYSVIYPFRWNLTKPKLKVCKG